MTHVWPKDDDFAAGSVTAYGDRLSQYLSCAFWSGATIAHPTIGSYTSTIAASGLDDAFSPASGGAPPRRATPITDPSGFLWRGIETADDVVATLGLQARVLTGSGHLAYRALTSGWACARVQGGTYQSASHSFSAGAFTGYYFGFLVDATREATWYLLRLNAGAITVLDSAVFSNPYSDLPPWLTSAFDPFAPFEVELSAAGTGATVTLTGKYRAPDATVSGGQRTTTIFSTTDTSGSRIVTAGRCGFAMNARAVIAGSPGGVVACTSTFFQVAVGGALVLRDEWQRAWRGGALAASYVVGSTTYTGNSMLQGFAGDWYGPTAFDRKLYRSQVGGLGDRVNFDPVAEPLGSGTGAGGFLLSQRAPTDPRSQNRSATIRFSTLKQDGSAGTTNPTTFRAAGIALRTSGSTTPSTSWTPTQGYLAMAYRDDATPATKVLLYRWRLGVATLIASTDPFTLAVDTDYVLRLDAYNQLDGSGSNVGPVVLRVFVDAVQVVLVAQHASVAANAAGSVTDASTDRIVEGGAEGAYVFLPNGDKTIFIDTWSEGTLTNSLFGSESDQASVAFAGENDDDSGQTLTIPLDWEIDEARERIAVADAMESGHVFARVEQPKDRRVWTVRGQARTLTERDDMLDWWQDHAGAEQTFRWVPPGEAAYVTVHIVADSFGTPMRDLGVHAFAEFEIEELF